LYDILLQFFLKILVYAYFATAILIDN